MRTVLTRSLSGNVALAVLVAGSLVPLLLPAAAPAKGVEAALAAAVRISGTRGGVPVRGSGFVVAVDQGVTTVMTASHVIVGARFEVTFGANATRRFPVDPEDILVTEPGELLGLAIFLVRDEIPDGVAPIAFDIESRPQAAESRVCCW